MEEEEGGQSEVKGSGGELVNEEETQEEEEEDQTHDQDKPPTKKLRCEVDVREEGGGPNMEGGGDERDRYEGLTKSDLVQEMKVRKLKVRGKTEEEMRRLLRREDRTQGRLNWGGHGTGEAA